MLQTDEIVTRRVVEVIPPEVSYELSDSGKELTEVLDVMAAWGRRESKRQNDKENTMG